MRILVVIILGLGVIAGMVGIHSATMSPELKDAYANVRYVESTCDRTMSDASPGAEKRNIRSMCDGLKADAEAAAGCEAGAMKLTPALTDAANSLAADVRDAVDVLNKRIKAAQEWGLSVEIDQHSVTYQTTMDKAPSHRTTIVAHISQPL